MVNLSPSRIRKIRIVNRYIQSLSLALVAGTKIKQPRPDLINEHGPPDHLQSDRGPEFASREVYKIQDQNDQIKTLSPVVSGESGTFSKKVKREDPVRHDNIG